MKITKTGESKGFKPYTINIEIECQGDEDVIENLGKSNISLPDMLAKSRNVKREDAYDFCRKINELYGNR